MWGSALAQDSPQQRASSVSVNGSAFAFIGLLFCIVQLGACGRRIRAHGFVDHVARVGLGWYEVERCLRLIVVCRCMSVFVLVVVISHSHRQLSSRGAP